MSRVSGLKDLSGECRKFLVSNLRVFFGVSLAGSVEVGQLLEELEQTVAGVAQVHPTQQPSLMSVRMRPKDAQGESEENALTDLLLKYGQTSCHESFPEVLRVFLITPNDLTLSSDGFGPSLNSIIGASGSAEQPVRTVLIFERVTHVVEANAYADDLPESNPIQSVEELAEMINEVAFDRHLNFIHTNTSRETADYLRDILLTFNKLRHRSDTCALGVGGEKGVAALGPFISRITDPLSEAWVGVLECIPGMSYERATAIALRYPTYHTLVQAYRGLATEEERRSLLSKVTIDGGYLKTAQEKTIGEQISAKVYLAVASSDSNTLF